MTEVLTVKKEGKIYKKISKNSYKAMQENRYKLYNDGNRPALDRIKEAALKASDNGRCWWIYQYIIGSYIGSLKRNDR